MIELNKTIIDIFRGNNEYIFAFDEIMSMPERHKFFRKMLSSGYRKLKTCSKCGRQLDTGYVYIIYYLEKADLLPEGFEPKCCFCYINECIGLEIPEEWGKVQIEAYNTQSFTLYDRKKYGISGIRITGYQNGNFFKFHFRIWNTDLTLKTGKITTL